MFQMMAKHILLHSVFILTLSEKDLLAQIAKQQVKTLHYVFNVLMWIDVFSRAEVFVPERVDNAQDGESRRDDRETLVLSGHPLPGHLLILTLSEKDLLAKNW